MQKGTKRHLSLGESVARLVSLGARIGLKARTCALFNRSFFIRFHTKIIFCGSDRSGYKENTRPTIRENRGVYFESQNN